VSISSTRSMLYKLARVLGDVNAVQKGKVGKRVARRAAGRMTGRALGRMFRYWVPWPCACCWDLCCPWGVE
jgi:hypothetical protein